jgi:Flp pilus assembly protein TadD
MRPRISVCVIVRDEERNLPGCLAAVRPLVDQIVVLDTGSRDRTQEIALQWGAEVFEFRWCDDFSAARNECQRHATGDWILWLDADDRLDSENAVRLIEFCGQLEDSSADAYRVEVFSSAPPTVGCGFWDTQTRLQRRGAGLRWQRRIREELVPANPNQRIEVRWSDLVIHHVGSEDPLRNRRKLHTDLRLSQIEYAQRLNDPQAAFAVGLACFRLGRLPEALRLFRRSMAGGYDTRKLYALLAKTLAQLGQDQEALEVCNQGLIEYPDDPELLYHRGLMLIDLGDSAGAYQTLVKLVNLPLQQYVRTGVEDGLQDTKGRCLLGQIYLSDRRIAEAEVQFRTAIRHHPRYAQAWLGLGQMYLDGGDHDGFRHAVAELRQCPGGATLLPALNANRLGGLISDATAFRLR